MNKTRKIAFSGVFLALALVLPFFTGQIQTIGNMLLPMHLPVLLCGMLLGPVYGGIVGFVAPLLRSLIWGMPPFMPTAVAMAFELMAYGVIVGIVIAILNKNTISTYASLIIAMIGGRIVWGVVSFAIYAMMGSSFTLAAFFAGGFTSAIPGIILQLVIIPPIVIILKKQPMFAVTA